MKKNKSDTILTNCNFCGVKWDESVVVTIDKVAEGLLNLTKLFNSQNIHIDTLLTIKQDEGDKK